MHTIHHLHSITPYTQTINTIPHWKIHYTILAIQSYLPPYMYSLLLLGYYSLIALVVSVSNFTRSHWLYCIEEIIAGHIFVVSQKILCSLFFNEKSLKIPKGQSESANWRRADITMSKMRKGKRTNNDLQKTHRTQFQLYYCRDIWKRKWYYINNT